MFSVFIYLISLLALAPLILAVAVVLHVVPDTFICTMHTIRVRMKRLLCSGQPLVNRATNIMQSAALRAMVSPTLTVK
jgi:hypothetical protein